MNQIIGRPLGGLVRFQGRLDEVGTVTVQATDRANNMSEMTYQVSITQGTQGGVPKYDTLGNMLNDGGERRFEWDAENRLLAVQYADGSRTEWVYDAQGRRIWEVERNPQGAEVSKKGRVWVGVECVQERSVTGTVTREHAAYGWLERSGTGSSQTTTRYVTTHDHLGSVREVRKQGTGELVARYSYGPYGEQPSTAYAGAGSSPKRFTSHDYHAKSGLHLALYRAYDARMGRWLSEDPIGENGGLNLYGYVGNSPLMAVDPLGLARLIGSTTDGGNFDFTANNLNELAKNIQKELSGKVIKDAVYRDHGNSCGTDNAAAENYDFSKRFADIFKPYVSAQSHLTLDGCKTGKTSGQSPWKGSKKPGPPLQPSMAEKLSKNLPGTKVSGYSHNRYGHAFTGGVNGPHVGGGQVNTFINGQLQ